MEEERSEFSQIVVKITSICPNTEHTNDVSESITRRVARGLVSFGKFAC